MIVKLVSSKGTGSFGGLADYILDKANDAAKIEEVDFSNCPYQDTEKNLSYIKSMQDLNQTAKSDKTMHLIVSFQENEKPTKEVLQNMEKEILKSIGMEEHHRLSVTHTNTNNFHMHIAINKISPETHKLIDPYRSKFKLSTKAAELEEKYNFKIDQTIGANLPKHKIKIKKGITHEPQGNLHKPININARRGRPTESIYNMPKVSEFKLVHDSKRAKMLLHGDARSLMGERRTINNRVRLSSKVSSNVAGRKEKEVKDFEIHSGMDSLLTWVKNEVLDEIKKVLKNPEGTLDDLHTTLAAHNLEMRTRGNGIVIGDKTRNLYIKASDVHRDLSKGKLTKRFGKFKTSKITTEPLKKFGKPKNKLWTKYEEQKLTKKSKKEMLLLNEKEERAAAKEKQKRIFDARLSAVNGSILLSKKDKYTQRQKIFLERTREAKKLSKYFSEKREAIFLDTKQRSYKEYLMTLALEGDTEALKTLRYSKTMVNKKDENVLSHPKEKAKHNIFLSLISKITKKGKAVYELKSGGKITDTGKELRLSIGKEDEDLVLALDMAIAQYGKVINVSGDNEFKTRVLDVVQKYNINIEFSDKNMHLIKERSTTQKNQEVLKTSLQKHILSMINASVKEVEKTPNKKSLHTKIKKLSTLYSKTQTNASLFEGDLNTLNVSKSVTEALDKVEVDIPVDSFIYNEENKAGISAMNKKIKERLTVDIEEAKTPKEEKIKKGLLERFEKFSWVLENKDSIEDITVSYYRNRGVDIEDMVQEYDLEISKIDKKVPAIDYTKGNIQMLKKAIEQEYSPEVEKELETLDKYLLGKEQNTRLSQVKSIKQVASVYKKQNLPAGDKKINENKEGKGMS